MSQTTAIPALFDLYPWQQEKWGQIKEMRQSKRLPHALIIGGVEGIGKLSFAKSIAASLLCQSPVDSEACGRCKSCQLTLSGSHPDFKLLEPKEEGKAILVDQIRGISHSLATTAQQGGARVVVINGASDLNPNAANALLKQLEEPGDNSYFLLIHQWPSRVLATVRSRCQVLDMATPLTGIANDWLQFNVTDEKLGEEKAQHLLQLANGAPLKAKQLHETKATEQRHQMLVELTAILRGNKTSIEVANVWQKRPLIPMLSWWMEWLSDLVRLKMTGEPDSVTNQDILKLLLAVGKRSDIRAVYQLMDMISEDLQYLNQRRNLNPQLVCEKLLNQWYLLVKSGT